jgi:hypothetical protein
MKKFILKVLLFFICVAMMDMVFGLFFSFLRAHAKGGSTANCEYIANRANDDIIILGSSRATHHYVPQIIEDSLGLSCYNCGEEGNGIVLAYGRLKMLTNRYNPKLVIYEITPGYDYGTTEPNSKYLGYLRAYYCKDGISEVFGDFDDELSSIKMISKMYQNTSRLIPDIFDNLFYRDNNKGYEPLTGELDLSGFSDTSNRRPLAVDSLKLSYLQKLIELCQCKNIPLVFMISPWYNKIRNSTTDYEPAIKLCQFYSIPVYNAINDADFYQYPELFQDVSHLNYVGSELYTKSVISLIKNYIQY